MQSSKDESVSQCEERSCPVVWRYSPALFNDLPITQQHVKPIFFHFPHLTDVACGPPVEQALII